MWKHFLKPQWFIIAVLVGSVLNVINQFDALFADQLVHWPRLLLTYAVPYFVSSLSAWFQ